MSIGITTGPIDFFMAGSVHRELLVVGPVATETAEIEAIADAGEIGLSQALARHLDPSCVGPPKGGALLLVAPPEAEQQPAPDVGSVSGLDVASCIPIASRAHVMLERSEPEHRTITAAFIDLMETDALLARLGPTEFAGAIDERISSIQEAALRYEVPFNLTDISKGSVKTLLTAGAPSSTGHDEEQMLRALREVMDEPGVVPMRVGVNTGRVFTGDFGPRYRRAYSVFGDAINTAARVMARAEAGQILSTEIVLERSRTTFETTPIEPFQAKGKAEPLEPRSSARSSGERASAARRLRSSDATPSSQPCLRGRRGPARERLDRRDRRRRRCRAGRGSSRSWSTALRTCGCSTRAARSTRHRRRTSPCARRCARRSGSSRERMRMRPSAACARSSPGSTQELVPWVPLLGILLGLDLPPTPETSSLDERFLRDTLADVALRFLVDTLGGTATMLAVEDVQFMDEASADLLVRLSRAAGLAAVCPRRHPLRSGDHVGAGGRRRSALSRVHAAAAHRSAGGRDHPDRDRRAPAATARRRGDRAPLRRQRAVPLRAARHGPRDRDDRSPAGFGRGGDRRRHRPARPARPDGAALRRGARGELRPRSCWSRRWKARWSSTTGSGSVCTASSIPTRPAACASATRSCATPPTRACRSDGAASCTPGSAQAIEAAAASPDEEAPTLALHFFEAQR